MCSINQEIQKLLPLTDCGNNIGSNLQDIIILGTAHPYKFLETVKKATGIEITSPSQLSNIIDKEERFDIIENNISKIKSYILGKTS